MKKGLIFYLCPKCFRLSEADEVEDHPHDMIRVDAGELTEEERKPLFDPNGQLLTRAPQWYLNAIEKRRKNLGA